MKLFVIDNGGQWTHREYRVLRDLNVDVKIVPNDTPFKKIEDSHGLILSGGTLRIGLNAEKMGRNGEYLDKAECPILGICAGHQFIAIHFGGEARESEVPEFGKTTLIVDDSNELFQALPKRFYVWQSHNDEVVSVPKDFKILAHSKNCKIQALKYMKKPFYGVQFHPEVEHTEYGREIFENFLKVCEDYRR